MSVRLNQESILGILGTKKKLISVNMILITTYYSQSFSLFRCTMVILKLIPNYSKKEIFFLNNLCVIVPANESANSGQ